ncbi:MAG: hypothetical protein NVS1B4_10460 [Gemmatimonadaceae bacterium]
MAVIGTGGVTIGALSQLPAKDGRTCANPTLPAETPIIAPKAVHATRIFVTHVDGELIAPVWREGGACVAVVVPSEDADAPTLGQWDGPHIHRSTGFNCRHGERALSIRKSRSRRGIGSGHR